MLIANTFCPDIPAQVRFGFFIPSYIPGADPRTVFPEEVQIIYKSLRALRTPDPSSSPVLSSVLQIRTSKENYIL
jgi:hypothetical protein